MREARRSRGFSAGYCTTGESLRHEYNSLHISRLFAPLDSDDSRHDEALASRIAALNLLDLSLDHLGLVTRTGNEKAGEKGDTEIGLARIVEQIGDGKSSKRGDREC